MSEIITAEIQTTPKSERKGNSEFRQFRFQTLGLLELQLTSEYGMSEIGTMPKSELKGVPISDNNYHPKLELINKPN